MKLSALYQIFLDCQLVTTDSRNCPEGSLFIALKGESFNGNAFAGKALETGCAYAVIDESEYAIEGDQRYIPVSYTHLDVYKRQGRERLAGYSLRL